MAPRHPLVTPATSVWRGVVRCFVLLWIELSCLVTGELAAHINQDTRNSSGVLVASACFNSTLKSVQLSCGSGHMIKITRTISGHSRTGECAYNPGDCTLKTTQNNDCAGRRNCTINLPSGNIGRVLPRCHVHSTYMQVEYVCVSESESVDICESPEVTTQTGYIHSPRYPLNYPTNRLCRTHIRVLPQQQLKLYMLELQLERRGEDCADSLYLQDSLHSHTICGHRYHELLFKSLGNQITLTFRSDAAHVQKGFWLYYEAIPIMTTTKAPPTTETSSVMATHSPDSTTAPSSSSTLLSVHTSSSSTSQILRDTDVKRKRSRDISMEAIIGGVLGSLLIILLVLVLLLLIKRRRETKFSQSTSSQQLNTPVVTPSANVVNYPWDSTKISDIEELC